MLRPGDTPLRVAGSHATAAAGSRWRLVVTERRERRDVDIAAESQSTCVAMGVCDRTGGSVLAFPIDVEVDAPQELHQLVVWRGPPSQVAGLVARIRAARARHATDSGMAAHPVGLRVLDAPSTFALLADMQTESGIPALVPRDLARTPRSGIARLADWRARASPLEGRDSLPASGPRSLRPAALLVSAPTADGSGIRVLAAVQADDSLRVPTAPIDVSWSQLAALTSGLKPGDRPLLLLRADHGAARFMHNLLARQAHEPAAAFTSWMNDAVPSRK